MKILYVTLGLLLYISAFAAHKTPPTGAIFDYGDEKVTVTQKDRDDARSIYRDIKQGDIERLSHRTAQYMDTLIRVAAVEMEKKGYVDESVKIQYEWDSKYFIEMHNLWNNRGIGDHAGLWAWIDTWMDWMFKTFGPTFMHVTHLEDIFIFNKTIPVVFWPCSFPMDQIKVTREEEYMNHFSGNRVQSLGYYGFAPTLSYWGAYTGCLLLTAGTGWIQVCGIAGSAVKWVVRRRFSDWLSDVCWRWADCSEGEDLWLK